MSAYTRLHTLGCLVQVPVTQDANAFDRQSAVVPLSIASASTLSNQLPPFSAHPLYTLASQIGSASTLSNQFPPFSAHPLYTLANQTEGTLADTCIPFAARPLSAFAHQVEREEQIDGSGKSVQGGERKGNMGVIDGVRTEANWDCEGVVSIPPKSDLAGGIAPKEESEKEIDDNGVATEGNRQGTDGDGTQPEGGKGPDGTSAGGHQGSEGSGSNGERGNWDGYENYLLYLLAEQRKAQSAESCKLLEDNQKLQASLESFRSDTDLKMMKLQLYLKHLALKIVLAMLFALLMAMQYVLPYTPEGKILRERIKKVLQQGESE
ncbi:uncharacterized protein [Lolium perenne]|nr:uncharacterized protein LOC127308779 isoform X3 [Lolium perenne]